MTDYDDTQESRGVASGHQVLEALEEALGVDDGIGGVGDAHVEGNLIGSPEA